MKKDPVAHFISGHFFPGPHIHSIGLTVGSKLPSNVEGPFNEIAAQFAIKQNHKSVSCPRLKHIAPLEN